MIERRPFSSLGGARHGWLTAKHHFSFAHYREPTRMGWGALRVWNDDVIQAHTGFDAHSHENMEIITYVRAGAITHQDSLGNRGRTASGDVQVMSAGSGIKHAEHNIEDGPTTLFQIWIEPRETGGAPAWGTKSFAQGARDGRFVVLASGYGEEDALPIRANARFIGAHLRAGETLRYSPEEGHLLYVVASRGQVDINGVTLEERDGCAIKGESMLRFIARSDAEVVLVDCAPETLAAPAAAEAADAESPDPEGADPEENARPSDDLDVVS